jgi:hypothetical protein
VDAVIWSLNKRAAGDAGIALRFQIEHHWPGAPEHDRSAKGAHEVD